MCQPGRPLPNRRLPRCLARLGRLPQRKVARRILLVLVHIHARAVFHAAQIFLAQLAVLRKRRQPEIPRPVFGFVRRSRRGQLLHQRHHLRNVLCRARNLLRPLDAQRLQILEERIHIARRVLADRNSRLSRIANNLVVHVGNVHHVAHTHSAQQQKAAQNIDLQEMCGNSRCGRSRKPSARTRTSAAPCHRQAPADQFVP